jgi:hypothetical protein
MEVLEAANAAPKNGIGDELIQIDRYLHQEDSQVMTGS